MANKTIEMLMFLALVASLFSTVICANWQPFSHGWMGFKGQAFRDCLKTNDSTIPICRGGS